MLKFKEAYFKWKVDFDRTDASFIFSLEDFFINVYKQTSDINLKSLIPFRQFLSEECLDLVDKTKKRSSKLDNDLYKEFLNLSSRDFNFNKIRLWKK